MVALAILPNSTEFAERLPNVWLEERSDTQLPFQLHDDPLRVGTSRTPVLKDMPRPLSGGSDSFVATVDSGSMRRGIVVGVVGHGVGNGLVDASGGMSGIAISGMGHITIGGMGHIGTGLVEFQNGGDFAGNVSPDLASTHESEKAAGSIDNYLVAYPEVFGAMDALAEMDENTDAEALKSAQVLLRSLQLFGVPAPQVFSHGDAFAFKWRSADLARYVTVSGPIAWLRTYVNGREPEEPSQFDLASEKDLAFLAEILGGERWRAARAA